MRFFYQLFCLLCLCLLSGESWAASYNMYGGEYTSWPSSWIALTNLNDPDDGLSGDMEIVGDSSNPAGYWAQDDNYVYFRMRIQSTAVVSNTPNGSLFVMIHPGGTNLPWAIAWDAKSDNNSAHGLEMLCSTNGGAVLGTSWGATKFEDLDNSSGSKIAPPDFGVSNGDGYIRTTDAVATTNFGNTTFVDFAAKWSYLRTYTGLNTGQTWSVQFGTIANATDHNYISSDVAGNSTPSTSPLPWAVSVLVIPMLSTLALLLLGGVLAYAFYRRQRNARGRIEG